MTHIAHENITNHEDFRVFLCVFLGQLCLCLFSGHGHLSLQSKCWKNRAVCCDTRHASRVRMSRTMKFPLFFNVFFLVFFCVISATWAFVRSAKVLIKLGCLWGLCTTPSLVTCALRMFTPPIGMRCVGVCVCKYYAYICICDIAPTPGLLKCAL